MRGIGSKSTPERCAILAVTLILVLVFSPPQKVSADPPTCEPATAGDGTITLTFNAQEQTSFIDFKHSFPPDNYPNSVRKQPVTASQPYTHTYTGLTNGVTYTVWGSDVYGSCPGQTLTAGIPGPAAPVLSGTAGNTQVTLNWTIPTGAQTYELKRGETVVYSSSNTTYTDTGLTNDTQYFYTVTAANSTGSSPVSV